MYEQIITVHEKCPQNVTFFANLLFAWTIIIYVTIIINLVNANKASAGGSIISVLPVYY